ncbi:hypothetical protein CEE37_08455 [candidate division LCP-89 bacterium B3_LCP]|uniref:NmrA-like domain-containing protein n=1 Tax=candidate division LCP-89 bacterium B3_LCP TaxID=2012998 RepID=A0A532UZJ9_UNCL8|nr:MAG: hypothetical protein CEE37_08455 [candidate division LCP-89 bacterium B3_LCP]
MYIVTGATGNIGRVIAETLLTEGKKVRVIGRSEERLQSLTDKGAEPFAGSMEDSDKIAKAFEGAEAAFAMLPPNLNAENLRAFQNVVSNGLKNAIEKNNVKYVVALSSIAAQLSEGTGPIKGAHDMEQKFNRIESANILFLRPAFFMENLFMQVDAIKGMGFMGSPSVADVPMPMIATKDIGNYAVKRLLALDFEGKSSKELLGQRDVSYNEIAKIFGKTIGKEDLKYVQTPYEDTVKAMTGMGLSQDVAESFVEMSRAFNEGTASNLEERSEANTTPTTIEEFANIFAAVYSS